MRNNVWQSNQISQSLSNQQLDFTLCEITNKPHNNDVLTHVKQCLKDLNTSKKSSDKKTISNKQNKQSSQKISSKNLNYLNLSRSMQQKSLFISKQKQEIAVLKNIIADITHNKQLELSQKNTKFDLEVNRLKQQQKEYIQNLAQLQQLKTALKEIRRKYELILNQKNSISQAYNDIATQNQELTTIISNLRVQVQFAKGQFKKFDLQEEITRMKQDLRNVQLQKQVIESRCSNFQKKLNDYILKYNQLQQSSNECQIKYYKLQKQCDDLRVDKDQMQQKFNSSSRQLQAEREINQEQVTRLKARLKKYEQKIQEQNNQNTMLKEVQRRRFGENEQLQQLNDCVQKLRQQNSKLKEQSRVESIKWQKYIKKLTQEFSQSKQELMKQFLHRQQTNSNQIERGQKQFQKLKQQLDEYSHKQAQLQFNLTERTVQLKQYQSKLQVLEAQTKRHLNIERKCNQLIEQNQRIIAHYTKLIGQKDQAIMSLNHYIQEIKDRQKIIQSSHLCNLEQIAQKQQNLGCQNNLKQSQINSLRLSLQKLQKQYSQVLQQKQSIEQSNNIQASQLSQLLVDSQKRQSQLKQQIESMYEQLKRIRQELGGQKRYYQQKYEKQLQQYNSLSNYLSQVNLQNCNLLKRNTASVLQISNIQTELASTQADLASARTDLNILRQRMPQQAPIEKQTFSLENKIKQLCSQIECLLLKLQQKQSQIAKMGQQITELHKINHTLDLKCQQLTEDNTYFSKQIDCHIIQLTELRQSNKNYIRITKQKQLIISKIKSEAEEQIKRIHEMAVNLQRIQQKYVELSDQYSEESSQWQMQKQQIRRQWIEYQNQKNSHENSRLSVNSYLDNSQVAVDILRQQNLQLQRIFDCQIERRNDIIRELIKQKKSLYQQLTESRSIS